LTLAASELPRRRWRGVAPTGSQFVRIVRIEPRERPNDWTTERSKRRQRPERPERSERL